MGLAQGQQHRPWRIGVLRALHLGDLLLAVPAFRVGGETSLGGLAALIAEMDLFINNDTGPAHIAEALAVPSIPIFGPADHRRWGPLDQTLHPIVRRPVECNPCLHWECPIDHRCLRWLDPALVIERAGGLLSLRERRQSRSAPSERAPNF